MRDEERGISVSEVARLLDVSRDRILEWSVEFADYLSDGAMPAKGNPRKFSGDDLRVMAMVACETKAGADTYDLQELLEQGSHNAKRWRHWEYANTPLFPDPPDGLEEMNDHGTLVGGMASRSNADLAKSYWLAAKLLLKELRPPKSNFEARELDYPILFLVRHCVELYLKALLKNPPARHDIRRLIELVEKQTENRLAGWVSARLHDFHRLDFMSDYFRYGGLTDREIWVDLYRLEEVMDQIVRVFDGVLAAHD